MKRIKTISYDRNSSETSVDIPVKKKNQIWILKCLSSVRLVSPIPRLCASYEVTTEIYSMQAEHRMHKFQIDFYSGTWRAGNFQCCKTKYPGLERKKIKFDLNKSVESF